MPSAFKETPLPKRLMIAVPHSLGAEEVRRRIDQRMDWAFRRLAKEKIQVETDGWFGNRRAFTGSGYGQRVSVAIQVTDDALQIEALLPWMAGMFAPVIEAIGRHYAGRLLSEEGVSQNE